MLTDTQIRKAKASDKPIKLTDSGGLYLQITPAGGKHWRYRYQFDGKEKTHTIGPYPIVSLADARDARDAARKQLLSGIDPSAAKKATKRSDVANSSIFETVAREWHQRNKSRWVPIHSDDILRSLEADVFPIIGSKSLSAIDVPAVLSLLRKIEDRGAVETAHRVRQRVSAVFVYAISSGLIDSDPAAVVKGALSPIKKGRQPAITDIKKARGILAHCDAVPGYAVTKLVHRLLALTSVRPGTLAETPWSELPTGAISWTIPAARMKLSLIHKEDGVRDHIVPLSRQAIETIEALRTLTGRGPMVAPNARHAHRPMSEGALGHLLDRAGYKNIHVPHGWRAAFSTIMNEEYPADRQIIDLMLAHKPKSEVEGAYNRALHLGRRAELAQIWADIICEGLLPPMQLVPFR